MVKSKWLLVTASAPSEEEEWFALVEVDPAVLEPASAFLKQWCPPAGRWSSAKVSELRLTVPTWWFKASTVAELMPWNPGDIDYSRELTEAEVEVLQSSGLDEVTECDELVFYGHNDGKFVFWTSYPAYEGSDAVTTAEVDAWYWARKIAGSLTVEAAE
jgi:hypothetical protein